MDRARNIPDESERRIWTLAGVLAIFYLVIAAASASGSVGDSGVLYWATGVGFTVASLGLLRLAGHRRRSEQFFIAFCGLTFPVWGMVLAAITAVAGGDFGWLPALLAGLYMSAVLLSPRTAIVLVAALVPAWLIAWLAEKGLSSPEALRSADGFVIRVACAAWVWNALVALELGRAAARAHRAKLYAPRYTGLCPACDYDLSGLPSLICPECGVDAAIASTMTPTAAG